MSERGAFFLLVVSMNASLNEMECLLSIDQPPLAYYKQGASEDFKYLPLYPEECFRYTVRTMKVLTVAMILLLSFFR